MKKQEQSLSQTVIRDSFWRAISMFFGRIGGLIFTIILAIFLLPDLFGLFTLATSIALMVITFADLGINQVAIRYISYNLSKSSEQKAAAYFQFFFKIRFFLALIVMMFLILLSKPLSIFVFTKPDLFYPLVLASIYAFVLLVMGFFEVPFYVSKKVKYLGIFEIISQTSKIILILILFFIIQKQYYLTTTLFLLIAVSSFVFSLMFLTTKKLFPELFKKSKFKVNKRDSLKVLGYVSLGSISGIFLSYIDVLMLGIFISTLSFIGYYKAAMTLVFGIAGIFAFYNIFLPVFTQSTKNNMESVLNKSIKYPLILAIPSFFGLIVLGKYIIRFTFGYEYLQTYFILIVLSLLLIENITSGLINTFFVGRGKPKYFVNILIISTILNIVLNLVFILFLLRYSEFYATIGAAVATVASRYFYSISLLFILNKKFKIKLKKSCYIKPAIAGAIMALCLFFINSFVSDMTYLLGALEILFGILIYLFIMFLIKGINRKDLSLVKYLSPKNLQILN